MTFASHLSHTLLFARQELIYRYHDNALGIFWLFAQSITHVLIFTLVFSKLMGARLSAFESQYAYSIYLVSGILPWNALANTLTNLASVYNAKSYLIKKVPLSLSLMPLYVPLVEAVIYSVTMGVFMLFLWAIDYPWNWHWLWLPGIMALNLAFAYGLGLILGMLNVFIPDIKNLTGLVLQFGFWLTPIVYVTNILPEWAQRIISLNPFYWAIESLHQIILFGNPPHARRLFQLFLLTLLIAVTARWLQIRLERDIRDLI